MASKYGIRVDFGSEKDAVAWFQSMRQAGMFPPRAALVRADGLDFLSGGVTPTRTLLVKSERDHPNGVVIPAISDHESWSDLDDAALDGLSPGAGPRHAIR